ncbi:hypothetical protein KIPB_004623, partial [Kipferlia bialata]
PAFAAVIGSVRVSYDIFGLAPVRARTLESLSPVGRVSICRVAHGLLRETDGFVFGESVSPNVTADVFADIFLCHCQGLLDDRYDAVCEAERDPVTGAPGERERQGAAFDKAQQAVLSNEHGLPKDRPPSRPPSEGLALANTATGGWPHMHIVEGMRPSAGASVQPGPSPVSGGVVLLAVV